MIVDSVSAIIDAQQIEQIIISEVNNNSIKIQPISQDLAVNELRQSFSVNDAVNIQPVLRDAATTIIKEQVNAFKVTALPFSTTIIDSILKDNYRAASWKVAVFNGNKTKYMTVSANWNNSIIYNVHNIGGDRVKIKFEVDILGSNVELKAISNEAISFIATGLKEFFKI